MIAYKRSNESKKLPIISEDSDDVENLCGERSRCKKEVPIEE